MPHSVILQADCKAEMALLTKSDSLQLSDYQMHVNTFGGTESAAATTKDDSICAGGDEDGESAE